MASDRGMTGVAVGDTVITLDGDVVGKVAEIRGQYFKVDVSMQPDFWLTAAAIRSAAEGQVVLGVDKSHVSDYKIDNPPTVGA